MHTQCVKLKLHSMYFMLLKKKQNKINPPGYILLINTEMITDKLQLAYFTFKSSQIGNLISIPA